MPLQTLPEMVYVTTITTSTGEKATTGEGLELEDEVTTTVAKVLPKEDPVLPISTMFGCTNGWKYRPANVVDGDPETYWQCSGTGQYIILGLGELKNVTQLDIAWHLGHFMKNDFTIQTSMGGREDKFTDVMHAVSTGDTDEFERYSLVSPVEAKFVKIIVNFNVVEKAAINEVVIHGPFSAYSNKSEL